VWNESFTFDIMHGKDPLQVMVMDKDTFGNDEFQGKCFVSLSILRDQMKHDQWVDLDDDHGQPM
jgi:Ca2+-dependent lipid-binding protein